MGGPLVRVEMIVTYPPEHGGDRIHEIVEMPASTYLPALGSGVELMIDRCSLQTKLATRADCD